MRAFVVIVSALALLSAGEAYGAAPALLGVGQEDRHATASFRALGADDVTVYIATSADRATDGRFLTENVTEIDSLTAAEIAAGAWKSADQLEPGSYFAMLSASTYSCPDGADCIDGFSQILPLAVPKPKQKFRAQIEGGYIGGFKLTVTPAGEDVPYKLCWQRAKGRKCVRGIVNGYDWNDAASDTIYLSVDDLKLGKRRITTFSWHVRGKRVLAKKIRVTE